MSGHKVKARRLTGKPSGRPSVEAAQLRDEVARLQGCEPSFETWVQPYLTSLDPEEINLMRWTWKSCWKYLGERAQEFIES